MKTIIIVLTFTLFIACSVKEQKSKFRFDIEGDELVLLSEPVSGYSTNDVINIVSDTVCTLFEDSNRLLLLTKAGLGSNINGIFYILKEKKKEHSKILFQHIDSLSIIKIDIFLKDIDKYPPSEIISIWNHEGDTYHVEIDKVYSQVDIRNIFTSKELGVPWIGNGQILTERNDSLLFLHMLHDGSGHVESVLNYDTNGRAYLKEVKRILKDE